MIEMTGVWHRLAGQAQFHWNESAAEQYEVISAVVSDQVPAWLLTVPCSDGVRRRR
jgi:hypothetical protein